MAEQSGDTKNAQLTTNVTSKLSKNRKTIPRQVWAIQSHALTAQNSDMCVNRFITDNAVPVPSL